MVMLGNLTGVVALTWEFGANGYITELTIPRLGNASSVHSYKDYEIAAAKSVNKIKSNAFNDKYSNYLDYNTSAW